MKNALFAIMMGLVGVFAVGCGGDPCSDAAEVCGAGDAEDGGDAECTGTAECAANCIVDNDSCDFSDPESAVSTCVADCAGAAE